MARGGSTCLRPRCVNNVGDHSFDPSLGTPQPVSLQSLAGKSGAETSRAGAEKASSYPGRFERQPQSLVTCTYWYNFGYSELDHQPSKTRRLSIIFRTHTYEHAVYEESQLVC